MANFYENMEKYIERNRMYHFEGEPGVRNLSRIAEVIGYGDRFSSSLEAMLADNPGLQSAMVEWLMEQNVDDWNRKLEEELGEED